MVPTNSTSLALDDAARLRAAPAASWGAILAGAAVIGSLTLILLALGTGLGFASVSSWPDRGVSASEFTIAGAIWLIVTQWLSAAAGGYVAGRLRNRWLATHTHEVFFRDTAHGLVTWCVATLVFVAVSAGLFSSVLGGGIRAAGGLAAAGAPATMSAVGATNVGATNGSPNGPYDLDKLFRNSNPGNSSSGSSPSGSSPGTAGSSQGPGSSQVQGQGPEAGSRSNDARMEVLHILARTVPGESLSQEDRTYVTNLVAAKTGISTEDAGKRVDTYLQAVDAAELKAKAAADKARKAAASAATYTALSMLMGAFIASVAAALGGRLRDEHT